jgi:hypothetical protein
MQEELLQDESVPATEVENARVDFEFGDLMLTCKCGAEYPIDKLIPKNQGIQVILVPNSHSNMIITCNECKSEIKLWFKSSSEEDINELKAKQNEQLSETGEAAQDDAGVPTDDQSSI